MSRALVGFLAISVLALSGGCTGLQGDEPHDDDDAASIAAADDWLDDVPGECRLSFTDAT